MSIRIALLFIGILFAASNCAVRAAAQGMIPGKGIEFLIGAS
jgi:hypothetical protein